MQPLAVVDLDDAEADRAPRLVGLDAPRQMPLTEMA
jgi:hypothetical protein